MISSMDEITMFKTKQNWFFCLPTEGVIFETGDSGNT